MRIRIDRPESMKKPYAEVIVDIEHEKMDRPFTYRVPEAYDVSCVPGSCVRIPFGSGERELLGFVVGRKAEAGLPEERIKEIRAVVTGEETAESRMILLAAWMSRRYGSTMIRALKTVLPVRKKYGALTERTVSLREGLDAEALAEEYADKHHVAKERVVRALMDGGTDLGELEKKARVPYQVIKGLEGEGVLQISTSELYRRVTEEAQVGEPDVLTEEQGGVLARIREEWSPSGRRRPVLLDGVTGSGKTVVYVELVADALREGRQAIVLIPEIALTRQTVLRFVRRFGNRVSFLHSRLSGGERYDQMKAAKSGEISVMVGPRSALFTPFPKLGLIIIDEEHEDTYHSELMPRYRSDEVAVKRGELEDARILLGSATPSLASAYRAEQGIYFGVRLNSRFGGSVLPATRIVDMRSELAQGNRSILSDVLYRAIGDRLKAGEQVILFLNRRGYTGQITCRSCGAVIKCPHCDVSLTLHRNRRMVCHYCGYEAQEVHRCPSCGSSAIGGMTIGTEQVEEIVRAEFPEVRVLRMDADTTRGKDGHSSILRAFSDGEADVLIGTQMIVKGHDFPRVTLVGVLLADLSLNEADYRSSEKTFQLITQAVGRAGRAERPGEAVIQTYQPEHFAIRAAAAQDYGTFYREELAYRSVLRYPPCGEMLAVLGEARDGDLLRKAMTYLRRFIDRIDPSGVLMAIGPAPQSIGRIRDNYREVIYMRSDDRKKLIRAKDLLEEYIAANKGFQEVHVMFDFS